MTSDNLLALPSDVAVAGNRDILLADPAAFNDDGGIIRVNPLTGAQAVVSQNNLFADPVGVALALNGDVLVVDGGCGCGAANVIRVNPTTGAQTVLSAANLLVSPTGIAVVPAAPATRTPTATLTSTPTGTATPTATPTSTSTPTATVTGTGTTTLTATVTVTGTLPASNTPSSTPSPTGTLSATGTTTPSATPSSTPAATGTVAASATASPSVTPLPSATPFVGQVRHAFLIPTGRTSGLLAQGPVEPGPCPRPVNNCLRFQVTGSFSIRGQLGELPTGLAPVLTVPVVPQSGTPPSTRMVNCQPATSSGDASCDATVPDPGIQPQVGGTVLANGPAPSPTSSATPIAPSTPTGTPILTATAGLSPTPTATSTPGSSVGATFHATFLNGSASAPVLAGPCLSGQPGCVQFTVSGGFVVSGSIAGLSPGGIPTLVMPVTTTAGAPAGTRGLICAPADATGAAQCSGTIRDPGIIPAVGGTATYTIANEPSSLLLPSGAAAVLIAPPPPLLPPLPPPLLAPTGPPLAPPGPLPSFPPGAVRPLPEEVPLIPETEPLWLILLGLAVAGGIALARRR